MCACERARELSSCVCARGARPDGARRRCGFDLHGYAMAFAFPEGCSKTHTHSSQLPPSQVSLSQQLISFLLKCVSGAAWTTRSTEEDVSRNALPSLTSEIWTGFDTQEVEHPEKPRKIVADAPFFGGALTTPRLSLLPFSLHLPLQLVHFIAASQSQPQTF